MVWLLFFSRIFPPQIMAQFSIDFTQCLHVIFCFVKWSSHHCDLCTAHSLRAALSEHKRLGFSLVIPLLIQDRPYTPNYRLIHPLHSLFPHSVSEHQQAGMWWERSHYEKIAVWGIVLQTQVWLLLLLGEIQSTLECPCGENTKAELCSWVWEEKCNNFHLNASTLPNTMGLSFTSVRSPPHSEKEACRDLALMRQQAFLWLVTNCYVWSLSLD